MLIFDGDYPMAHGALIMNRDLTRPIEEVRNAPRTQFADDGWPDSETMATLPEMRKGQVAAALMKICVRIERPDSPIWGYRSGDIAFAMAQGQLAYYRSLETKGEANIITEGKALAEHMDSWAGAEDTSELPVGMVLGIEGADSIQHPEQVHDWKADGIRVVGLTHYGPSTYAHGTGTGLHGGLFEPARELLKEMESAEMILDLTHASDESIRQALELFSGPIIASHQNCRAMVPGERQFPDEILNAIIEREGVIGSSMDTWMLYRPGLDWGQDIPDRRKVFPREAVTLEDFADHIDHVCLLAGNSLHAGIGGDTDGQGGCEGAPLEIDTVADYRKLASVLENRGHSAEDIENIMYRNWQRFYEKWL